MSYIYLASPYTHSNPTIREQRYLAAQDAVVWLLKQRKWVYSPIVHCHELCKVHELPRNYKFWEEYNGTMLFSAHTLYVLNLDGVMESKGAQGEIEFAAQERKPIFWLTPQGDDYIPSRHYRSTAA